MRRWNGWGDESIETTPAACPRAARVADRLGTPPRDATSTGRRDGPAVTTAPTAGLDIDPGRAIRHARGQSLPDWVALRSGRLGAVPDAVARPPDAEAVRALIALGRQAPGPALIPYGGGTSVVGGVTARPSDRPLVTVDLGATAGLHALDETSGLATFGAGTTGPGRRSGARAARPDARPLPAVVRGVDGRRLGRHALGRPAVARVRSDRGPLRGRPPRDAARAARPPAVPGLGRRARPARDRPRLGGTARDPDRRHGPGDAPRRSSSGSAATSSRTGTGRCSSPGGSRGPVCRCRWSASRRRSRPRRRSRSPATAASTGLLRRYLGFRGMGPERCLAIVGLTGNPGVVGRGGEGRRRPRPRLAGASPVRASGRPGGTAGSRHRTCATRCGTRATRSTRSRPRPTGRRSPTWPPRSGERSGTGSRARTSASTPSATCRTPTRAGRACTSPTSSGWPRTRTRRSSAGGRSRPPRAGSSSNTGRRSATSTASAPTTRRTSPPRRARSGWRPSTPSSGRSTRTAGWRAGSCSRTALP